MYKWIVKITNDGKVEEIRYGIRPAVSLGERMARLASIEREDWIPLPVDKIEIIDTGEESIFEILYEKDLDELYRRALDLAGDEHPEQSVLGKITMAAIQHYRLSMEVKARIEEEQREATTEQ